ncbi:DUF3150 domain-containing protein [Vibrio sp. 10N.239.312.D08]|uniref:DUF3150 domain-containing protein n=1 Tax=Vibrio sp. 10N.239.312.D08 TaxID=3229978 RepID=UPI003550536D
MANQINTQTINDNNSSVAVAVENTLEATKGHEGVFVIIPFSVSVPSPSRTVGTLKHTNSSGQDVTDNRKVGNATVEMFSPKEINFGKVIRDRVRAMFREHGFNLGNGLFLISETKVEWVYSQILSSLTEFEQSVETFLDEYPSLIKKQMFLQPKLREEISKYHPSVENLRKAFRFRIGAPQAVQVHSCVQSVQNLFSNSNVQTEIAAGLIDPIVESLAQDMKHFWNYNIRSVRKAMEQPEYREDFTNPSNRRSGIRGVFLTILQNMQSKVKEAEKLEPSLAKVSAEFDKMMKNIPDSKSITKESMYFNYEVGVKINEFATRMSEAEYLMALINAEKGAKETVDHATAIAELAAKHQLEAESEEEREVSLTDFLCGNVDLDFGEESEPTKETSIAADAETNIEVESQEATDIDVEAPSGEVDLADIVEPNKQQAKVVDVQTEKVDTKVDTKVETPIETPAAKMPIEQEQPMLDAQRETDSVTIETSSVEFDALSVTIDSEQLQAGNVTQKTAQAQQAVIEEEHEPELQTIASLSNEVDLEALFADL